MQLKLIISYMALCCALLPIIAFAQDDNLLAGDDDGSSPTFTLFNPPFKIKHQADYNIEFVVIGISILLIFKMIFGRRTNRNLAILYVAELDRDDGVLKKQFAEAEPTVIIDGPETFKFYATGRRYCQGALFTFRMARRHDLLDSLIKFAQKDVVDIEINMNESSMPSTVLFIGTHSAAKTVTKEIRDIVELAKRMEPTRDRLATWPGLSNGDVDEPSPLIVHAEQPSVFYEVMSPIAMEPFLSLSKYFRYMHASSDYRTPFFTASTDENSTRVGAFGKRNVVRFSFTLPPSGELETLDKIVSFVCLVIDGLGTCKLTPEQVKKAADLRRTVEAKRESTIIEKERKLEERRAAKEAEERARLAKLPPDQREKERAKRDKILKQRKLKSLSKRI